MSKDVRRLFAVQKAAKASSSSEIRSSSASLSSRKRITHPLAKYDPTTFRLTCAICGPAVPIKSDNLWNAHLVSKAHQDAVAKLRAVKEQMQKREQAAVEAQQKLQQQQDTPPPGGVKRKAAGGLVAYADDSESESEDESESAPAVSKSPSTQDSKRIKLDNDDQQAERQIEEEEETLSGLPAGFFDSPHANNSNTASNSASPAPVSAETRPEETQDDQAMEGVLPAGFFDDPEEDARIRAEVGGATTDQQQRQVDAEFKALQAELARDIEQQDEQETKLLQAQNSRTTVTTSAAPKESEAGNTTEPLGYEEKVEQEEQELEETILARSEEEYQLFVEMAEKLNILREKKTRLLTQRSLSTATANPLTTIPEQNASKPRSAPSKRKTKGKSILDMVRERELERKEKERRQAEIFNKLNAAEDGDSKMAGSDGEEESEESDEDIEAMMDWRARRV
ncbi:hypothetical protein BGW38_001289 [Lunasporangiospora selenospora]|uniref:Coiled-coil domain-containing protein 16 n=1 Tax=Lunasporangiospora selenospora TaxID=979761 RepID=A0A9P6G1B8_9FUNG|nr:hypothetical protein BGW38_001289 [Lunasporangiospora selenospora]